MLHLKNLLWIGLVVVLMCGSNACSYDEGYFNQRIKELDQLASTAAPGMREKIEKKKTELLADFRKRPAADQGAMDRLCRRARMTVKETKQILAVVPSAGKKANAGALKAYRERFVGLWMGAGTSLIIDASGRVKYSRKKGASGQVVGRITDFQRDHFKVGFMGISATTFKINRAPFKEGGAWKMTIDGVELIRVGDAPKKHGPVTK